MASIIKKYKYIWKTDQTLNDILFQLLVSKACDVSAQFVN